MISTLEALENLQKNNLKTIIGPHRNLKFYYHGTRQKAVVVLLHGLYQSPRDQIGLSELLFESGCNVIAPLLPGHWQKDRKSFYQVTEADWVKMLEDCVELAKEWGEHIHLVGHSTGALLSLNYTLKNPNQIASVIALAPALKIKNKVTWVLKIGHFLKLDRRHFTFRKKSEYTLQPKPFVGSRWVLSLIKTTFGETPESRKKVYQNYQTPTLVFSTDADGVIDTKEVKKFALETSQATQLINFPKRSGVYHDNIQRSHQDLEPNDPIDWQNPYFSTMAPVIVSFIKSRSI